MKAILKPVKGEAAIKLDKIFTDAKLSKPEPITKEQRDNFMKFLAEKHSC